MTLTNSSTPFTRHASRFVKRTVGALLISTSLLAAPANRTIGASNVSPPRRPVQAVTNRANGRIAFARRVSGSFQIYTMNADGSDQKQITNDSGSDNSEPAWSPDGTRIAFTKATYTPSRQYAEIFLMNADGSSQKQLTSNGYDRQPAWSPDGTKIVFSGGNDFLGIYVINADGSNQTRLTSPFCCQKFSPDWSHDGMRIVFATWENTEAFLGSRIYAMNTDGTNLQRIYDDGSYFYSGFYLDSPKWSPDDGKILFTSGDDFSNFLAIMNADGTGRTFIELPYADYHYWVTYPAWSPDGTKIVFTADGQIYVAEADGSHAVGLSNNSVLDSTPAWQPVPLPPAQIDDSQFFVRQQYLDFLNREPDADGLVFWKDNIDKCNDPARRPAGMSLAQCIEVFRINTSAAFFLSIEFQNTGYFVERTYKTSFGDISPPTVPVPVRFTDFIADTQQVGAGVIVGQVNWQTQLDDNKSAFALSFVQRSNFLNRYPALISATAFVETLNGNAGSVLSDSERSALISELSPHPSDPVLRAGVLCKIADNALLQQREFNRAFVLMEYFGYLRRNPNDAPDGNFDGYNFWLNKLNQFNGNYIEAEMVKAFINSAEYRQRFAP